VSTVLGLLEDFFLASALAITGLGPLSPTTPPTGHIKRLWRDHVRAEQLARLQALELQAAKDYGERVWEMAYQAWRQIPEPARVDLPSPHVFARVLGLFRTGATLKTGKLLQLEISAEEIANLLGYSKSTIEAALRWLDSGPIDYMGDQLARGLGLVHRGRRTAWAILQGKLQRVYRTSKTVLTGLGRLVLGLGDRYDERLAEKRQARVHARHKPEAPVQRQAVEPIVGAGGTGEGGPPPNAAPTAPSPDVGREWLRKIRETL
jgi:hypothetical protein